MGKFTVEEINLMCIYGTGTRLGLIVGLEAMSSHLEPDETELLELTRSVTEKLRGMSDEEYAGLSETLIPDYEEQEE
ncbi:transposon-transfer assisting family protein [Oscillospiraceae bacterium CM]|nr:transposon-transfer assisting family protein [Oscillospiraceae bacterium CM]